MTYPVAVWIDVDDQIEELSGSEWVGVEDAWMASLLVTPLPVHHGVSHHHTLLNTRVEVKVPVPFLGDASVEINRETENKQIQDYQYCQ